MNLRGSSIVLLVAAAAVMPAAYGAPATEFCEVLRSFVESVQPDEAREFTFRTSWGTNFKDTEEPAIAAKRCDHQGYAPGESVCAYLMEHGSTEFSSVTVKEAISCLSRGTKFGTDLSLGEGAFSFSYGSEDRGALIDITLGEDPVIGGMVFRLAAEGY